MDVAVIDHNGGLLSGVDGTTMQPGSDDRADILRARAERVLAARVGPGNAVVEVTMETVTDTETISERIFDPESRVAISTDVQESAEKSEDSRGGDVTVASNVPDGDAGSEAGAAANENSETRALTNFEVSQTQREVLRSPGAVRRLTVAVLVNEATNVDVNGIETTEPRTPEELADLEQLVASAVGYDADRGDEITLRAMPFEPLPELGSEAQSDAVLGQPLDMMRLIQIGALAGVAILLGLFVVRPILTGSGAVAALPPPDAGTFDGTAENFGENGGPQMMSAFPDMMAIEGPDMGGMGMGDMGSGEADAVGRLRQMISDKETETLQILEDWMEDQPETAKTT
jgi:flagellar M-ring protein FliF